MKTRIYKNDGLWIVGWDGLEYATVSWRRAIQFAQSWRGAHARLQDAA